MAVEQKKCENKKCVSIAVRMVHATNMKVSKWLCSPCADKQIETLRSGNGS